MSRPLYLLVLCVIAQLTGAQELLAAAHGFPSLGELAGVVADEVSVHFVLCALSTRL